MDTFAEGQLDEGPAAELIMRAHDPKQSCVRQVRLMTGNKDTKLSW